MARRTGPTNVQLQNLIQQLETQESKLWKRIAKDLSKPSRNRRVVNLYKINKYAREGETIVVPGKVLSVGDLDKKVNVAAFTFSTEAKEKILRHKGTVLSIQDLLKQNPEGKQVRILG